MKPTCRDRGVCPDNNMKATHVMPNGDIHTGKSHSKDSKKVGYNARLDESLGMRDGKESSKSQSLKSRRDESKGENKKLGRRAYSSVKTMDKARKKVKGKKDRY